MLTTKAEGEFISIVHPLEESEKAQQVPATG